jgi:hypothetical protein
VAEVVDKLPKSQRGGSLPTHPWDDWFDGRPWKLTRGEDFQPEPRRFRRYVHHRAVKRGQKVETRVDGDDLYIRALR